MTYKLLQFSAKWCGSCKSVTPKIEQLMAEHPDIIYKHIDVDEDIDTAQQYEITTLPTFIFLEDTKEVKRIYGTNMNSIKEFIQIHE